MNNPTETVSPASTVRAPGMLLHCGAETVDEADLASVRTPEPTKTWFPLAHADLATEVQTLLTESGFEIGRAVHSLSHHGARYFGVLQVRLPDQTCSDYGWIVGLRNSHDKTYPAGLVAGTRVLVCDNLSFTGEVKLSRKHTRHAVRDVKNLAARAIGQLGDRFHRLDERIVAYRNEPMPDWAAHDLVVRAVDAKAITASQLPHVLHEWRRPRFPDFEPRNAWSLFNAFTEVHKQAGPHIALRRGEALHGLFDAAVGIN